MKAKRDNSEADEGLDESSSSSGSKLSKLNPKKIIKIGGISVSVCIIVYNVFLSNDNNPDTVISNPNQQTTTQSVDPVKNKLDEYKQNAKDGIQLNNAPTGDVFTPPPVPKSNKEFDAVSNVNNPDKLDVSPPDVPNLPDFVFKEPERPKIEEPVKKVDELPSPPMIEKTAEKDKDVPKDELPQPSQNILNPDEQIEKLKSAPMFIVDSGNGSYQNQASSKPKSSGGDGDFIIYDKSRLIQTSGGGTDSNSKNTQISQVTDLENRILQGKMMDVILETAINSQLPGTTRGIISRDVFGEAGTKILIPKGTRVYGTYSTTISRGQSRINITWNRVIRPDGVSIAMTAQASDQFGRAGIESDVDNRFAEIISNSLLLSFVNLGTAVALDKITGSDNGQTQVVNNNGSVATTNINPINMAAQTIIQQTSDIVKTLTDGALNLSPVATLPQGTKIKIIVNQDITLPDYKKGTI